MVRRAATVIEAMLVMAVIAVILALMFAGFANAERSARQETETASAPYTLQTQTRILTSSGWTATTPVQSYEDRGRFIRVVIDGQTRDIPWSNVSSIQHMAQEQDE